MTGRLLVLATWQFLLALGYSEALIEKFIREAHLPNVLDELFEDFKERLDVVLKEKLDAV